VRLRQCLYLPLSRSEDHDIKSLTMRRRKSQPGRTFALTVLLLLAIALLSLLLPSLKPYKEPLLASRDLSTLDHSKVR